MSLVVCTLHRGQQGLGELQSISIRGPVRVRDRLPCREFHPESWPSGRLAVVAIEDVDGEVRQHAAIGAQDHPMPLGHGGISLHVEWPEEEWNSGRRPDSVRD